MVLEQDYEQYRTNVEKMYVLGKGLKGKNKIIKKSICLIYDWREGCQKQYLMSAKSGFVLLLSCLPKTYETSAEEKNH